MSKGGKDGERDELDVELKIIISLLHELIINWWQPRVSVISFLWDCFHKRLDQPFLLQTSGPWALSLEKYTRDFYNENFTMKTYNHVLKCLLISCQENCCRHSKTDQ